eukprot:g396.t1
MASLDRKRYATDPAKLASFFDQEWARQCYGTRPSSLRPFEGQYGSTNGEPTDDSWTLMRPSFTRSRTFASRRSQKSSRGDMPTKGTKAFDMGSSVGGIFGPNAFPVSSWGKRPATTAGTIRPKTTGVVQSSSTTRSGNHLALADRQRPSTSVESILGTTLVEKDFVRSTKAGNIADITVGFEHVGNYGVVKPPTFKKKQRPSTTAGLITPEQRRLGNEFEIANHRAKILARQARSARNRRFHIVRNVFPNGIVGVDNPANTDSVIYPEASQKFHQKEQKIEEGLAKRRALLRKRTQYKERHGYDFMTHDSR